MLSRIFSDRIHRMLSHFISATATSLESRCILMFALLLHSLSLSVMTSVWLAGASGSPNSQSLVFLGFSQNVTAYEGGHAQLVCKVNLVADHQKVIWLNESSDVISLDRRVLMPGSRISVRGTKNFYNLDIKNVSIWDEGRYICQVTGSPPVNQPHWLTVLTPSIITDFYPDDSVVVVRENKELRLVCIADGRPRPWIVWRKSDDEFEVVVAEGEELLIRHVDHLTDSGLYICEASNDIGKSDVRSVVVQVEFAPQVEVQHSSVHTGPGQRVSLECSFQSNPPVSVYWLHNKTDLRKRDNFEESEEHSNDNDKYRLTIKQVSDRDIGLYGCKGSNVMGEATGTIELSFTPFNIRVTSDRYSRFNDRYTAVWNTSSYSSVLDYNLVIKQTSDSSEGAWHNVTLPATISATATTIHSHKVPLVTTTKYTFDWLKRTNNYTLRIQARNKYGKSDWSNNFYFKTASKAWRIADSSKCHFLSLFIAVGKVALHTNQLTFTRWQ